MHPWAARRSGKVCGRSLVYNNNVMSALASAFVVSSAFELRSEGLKRCLGASRHESPPRSAGTKGRPVVSADLGLSSGWVKGQIPSDDRPSLLSVPAPARAQTSQGASPVRHTERRQLTQSVRVIRTLSGQLYPQKKYQELKRNQEATMTAHKKIGRMGRIVAMIALTLAYFFVEIVTGHITGSIALVADSFHMLSDVVALIVGLVAVRISKMNSPKSTFGWVRAEVLGALVNSVFLLALCFTILVDAVQRLVQPEDVENPKLMLTVGSVGLGINLIGLVIFRDHSHGHSHGGHSHGNKEQESLLKGDPQVADGSALLGQQQLKQPVEQRRVVLRTGGDSFAVVVENDEADGEDVNDRLVITIGDSASCGGQLRSDQLANAKSTVERSRVDASNHHVSEKKSSRKNRKGTVESSSQLNMRAIFLHVLGDALGSVVVIVSSLLIWLVPDIEGEGHIHWKPYIDPVLSLVLVAIIIATTLPLLKESALILLQAVPTQLKVRDVRQALEKMEGVQAVRELHVWQLTGSRHVASLHLSVVSLEDYIRLSSSIRSYFHDNGVHSVTIQPEFTKLHLEKECRDIAREFDLGKSCNVDVSVDHTVVTNANATIETSQNLMRLGKAAASAGRSGASIGMGSDSGIRLLVDVPNGTGSSTCYLGVHSPVGISATVAPVPSGLPLHGVAALGGTAAEGGDHAEGPPIA